MTGLFQRFGKTSLHFAIRCAALASVFALAGARADEIEVGGRLYRVPPGCTLELAASPPLVERPICIDFDPQGRLYVAESSGSNDDVNTQLQERPHKILRLADVDGDGVFDQRTVFADRMMFPEGCLWYDGSVYVSAPPTIWKLTDTDDDGVADLREEWLTQTLTGCANDLHGPYAGPDGWLYWCKGAFAEQTYERADGQSFVTRAAHIFRRRPEGGEIEHVLTGGMENAVAVAFAPAGERRLTTTFFQHPGGGRRDGLIHAIYGGVYGKRHSVIDGHPRTGELMPVLVHMGAAAPCGLLRLKGDAQQAAWQNSLLACYFNLHKVVRHRLIPTGATFTTEDVDFVATDDLDFHPTDVVEDADGSVLIVDTGGWYKLCCPTSQLWKPDVLGGIYRLRHREARQVDDPRGANLRWGQMEPESLFSLLSDRRPAVRERAMNELAAMGAPAVAALRPSSDRISTASQRALATWTLGRVDDPRARAEVRERLHDRDDDVRGAAIHLAGLWGDAEALSALTELLSADSPHQRRAAAEALGRIGLSSSVPALLSAAAEPVDRVLEHSLIYALIDIGDAAMTRQGLAHDDADVVKAALIALAEMPGGDLAATEVVAYLDAAHPALAEAAWWIAQRHPEWAPAMVEYFRTVFEETEWTDDVASALPARLASFAADPAMQSLLATALQSGTTPPARRAVVLAALRAANLKTLPEVWAAPLAALLTTGEAAGARDVVHTIASFEDRPTEGVIPQALAGVIENPDIADDVRLQALALVRRDEPLPAPILQFVCSALAIDHPPAVRALAVDTLRGGPLDEPQLYTVADALATTGPMELKQLVPLFNPARGPSVGLALVSALSRAPAAASLDVAVLEELFTDFGADVAEQGRAVLKSIADQSAARIEKLETVLAALDQGDIRRGQAVFNSSKAACAACHEIGYLGGQIGPDLTSIGRIRSPRDLAEAILFPSASFVRSYEPVIVATVDGQVYNGLIRDETEDELVLTIDAQKTLRIPKDDIEERQPGTLSIMPAGLDQQLSFEELVDLVKFLTECRR